MGGSEVAVGEVSSASQIASGFFHGSLAASPGTSPSLPAISWPLKKPEEQSLISFQERDGGMNGGASNTPQLLAAGPLPQRQPQRWLPAPLLNSSFPSFCLISSVLFSFLS